MSSPGSRLTLRRALVAVGVLLVLVVGGAVAFLLLHKPGNVSNPNVEFTRPTPAPDTPPFDWPTYGYDAARTRYFPSGTKLDPPFRVGWVFEDYALLEFPPVIYGHALYQIDDDGSAKGIDARTGHKLWETKLGMLAAASPAVGAKQGLVFVPVLSVHGHSPGNGKFVALSMKTGRIVWSRPIPAGTESSPLASGNSVYFGDQRGAVYSLNASTGRVNWIYHAASSVKGGPALADGRLFFGDYAGRAYALNPANGHKIWAVATNGAEFGFGSGNFYATPAVAFGRVYMGNTDGRVYSFAEKTGALGWATGTGAYVYASPAVADLPGIGPTVYEGSYDGHFYAFNAQTGAIRWAHRAGGRISGSATILGNIVYYSTLGLRTTTGLDAITGKKVFFWDDGAFNPIIADNSTVYLTGYTKLYEMIPVHARTGAATSALGTTTGAGQSP
jgi:outer membrane protein assembly factor BamB